jgi:NAD(P)H-hydrate epimerase
MSGAIALAGMGALRGGAGLVTLAVPEVCVSTVAAHEPSYMTVPLQCDAHGRMTVSAKDRIAEISARMTCLACGPGLGRSQQLTDLVGWMYEVLPQPIVFDADALFALAQRIDRLDAPAGPRILTPHPGEFRSFVEDAPLQREQSEQLARHLAASRRIVIALKGHRTLVTDGVRSFHNTTGNPGMASGGSGDVLTGLITAMMCQGLEPFDAARLACHVHGLAGDLAAEQLGQTSLIASDLVQYLPQAFLRLEGNGGD